MPTLIEDIPALEPTDLQENKLILDEQDTGATKDLYLGMCDCNCKSRGCRCDCHDCAFWQNK